MKPKVICGIVGLGIVLFLFLIFGLNQDSSYSYAGCVKKETVSFLIPGLNIYYIYDHNGSKYKVSKRTFDDFQYFGENQYLSSFGRKQRNEAANDMLRSLNTTEDARDRQNQFMHGVTGK